MEKRNTEKLGTILGFISGTVFILMGILWPIEWSNLALILGDSYESDNAVMNILLKITRFLDLKSIFIVFGGTLSATFIAYPYQKTLRSFGSVGRFFCGSFRNGAEEVYEQARKIGEKRFNGKRLTNEDLNSITNPFMRRWVEGLIIREQVPEEMLDSILRSEIEMYEHRADEEIEILDFMSTAAPAFGMMGTIVGLVLMLAETGSVRAVMQSMSIAMLTTLYGVIISNLIIQPLASKRKQLKESNRVLMEMVRESVQCIARRESPYNMLQELSLFLPSKREDFDRQYG